MIERYRDGVVPADGGADGELAAEAAEAVAAVKAHFAKDDVTGAIEAAWVWVRRLNRLVEEREPWTLAKDDAKAAELDQALFSVANGLRIAAILLWPVIPGSCEKVLVALGEPADEVSLARATWDGGTPGAVVAPGDPLFPRVEVEEPAA